MAQIKTKFIKDLAVTTAKIAADAVDKTKIAADVAGVGLSQAAGGELDVDLSAVSVTAHSDVSDAGSGAIITTAERSKLGGIEALADVTDATNVDAAGATMNTDSSLVGNGYFLDDDTMAGDDAARVASQRSIRAYVTNSIATAVASEMSFKGDYNAATNTPLLDETPIATEIGDMYVVTVAGTFFSVVVEAGDVLIAKQATATLEAHWSIVQANLTTTSIKSQYESNANTNAFTDAEKTNLGNQSGTNTGDEAAASQSVAGVAEVATVAEIDAKTDDTRMVSPLGLAGSALQLKVDGIEAGATADQSAAEVPYTPAVLADWNGAADPGSTKDGLDQLAQRVTDNSEALVGSVTIHGDVSDAGSGAIISSAERSKLSGIEALADVTDATNVAAAGAVMESDTSTALMSFVVNDALMIDNSATKVPTQQSVKAYVDSQVSGISAGNGLEELVANTLSVKADITSITTTEANAISVGANGVGIKVDNSSIEGSAQGAASTESLRVKALGITNDMLAGSIADSKLNQITTGNKVAGSAVQITAAGGLEDSSGLQIKADATINPTVLSLTTNGLAIKIDPLQGMTTNGNGLKVNTDNATIRKTSGGVTGQLTSLQKKVEIITLSAGDITAEKVVLAENPFTGSVSVSVDGVVQESGVDFSVNIADVRFGDAADAGLTASDLDPTSGAAALVAGDKMVISYEYINLVGA